MGLRKLFYYILILIIASADNMPAQQAVVPIVPNDSVVDKEVDIREITVEKSKSTKLTGISSGKIMLHTEGIKSIPTLTGTPDVLKILELTPGVQTSGEGISNIYVRGGSPGHTLILYAGIPVYTPGHALSIFPLFNADNLSSVELIKGGVDAAYGGFLSGAVILKPKKEVPSKTSLKGSAGLLFSQAALEIKLNDKFGAYVSARKTYLELLLNPLLNLTINRNAKEKIEDVAYGFYDINAAVVGKLSPHNKLDVNFFTGKDQLDISEDFVGMKGRMFWNNTGFSGRLETVLGANVVMDQQVVYSRFQNNLHVSLSETYVKTFSKIASTGYDNKLRYAVKNIALESGLQYKYYELFPQDFEKVQSGFNFNGGASFGKMNARSLALFTTAKINIIPGMQLEPGVRYNYFRSETERHAAENFHHLDFRIFGRYQISGSQFIRGTLSHNSQYVSKLFPSSTGLPTDFWVAASSGILPQYSSEVSLGYYQAFTDGMFELSADIYCRTIENAAEYNQNFIENDNQIFTEKILFGGGRAYGIELMLKKNHGRLTGWVSYSLGRSELKFDEIDNGAVFPARHDRTHDLSLTAAYLFSEKWDVSLTQVYATGNAYTAPESWYFINNMPVKEYGRYNNGRLPDYRRTDIGLNYWFKKDNGLNLSIYNLFMVSNPLYVSLRVNQVEDAKDKIIITMKKKNIFTIMPSISWRFKF